MEEFKKKFKEEAIDLIQDLEKAVLSLEESPDNSNLVEQVFRVMHSLKGGGAMFGFDKISEFTHHLETIYDLVRNNKMKISTELLSVTLASVDHLEQLLNNDTYTDELLNEHQTLTDKIMQIVAQIDLIEKEDAAKQSHNEEDNHEFEILNVDNNSEIKTYYIYFQPNEDIFNNGTNPLYLIDELATLGETRIFTHIEHIPEFFLLNPTLCYTSWAALLATKEAHNAIQDVFIFVEDECVLDIQKISDENLLRNNSFNDYISKMQSENKLQIVELKEYIKKLEANNEEKKQETAETKNERQNPLQTGKQRKESVKEKVQSFDNKRNNVKENIISSIRVSSDKIDRLMNLVSELVTTQASLTLFTGDNQVQGLLPIAENVENLTRMLRDITFSISLIPLETLMTRFQRLIRDLSNEMNKEIVFKAEGTDTELDKNIIQSLTDPLMHIIRNSIDHGIEPPDEREKSGKPRKGTITLRAYYSGANVQIEIGDDGKGIDKRKIREKAIQKKLIKPEDELNEKDIYNMLFMPGFSTASMVTDVSGRGVGMDVVKRKIAEIRGEIEIDSIPEQGTTITIGLPLTLSIIDGLLVKIDDTDFILPLSVVDKIYAVEHKQLVNNFNNIIVLDREQIPFYYLSEEFNLTKTVLDVEEVVVVTYEDKRIGLAVDTVTGEYQAVLKPLGKLYKNQEFISGASILGDGTVALVLDTNKLIKILSHEK